MLKFFTVLTFAVLTLGIFGCGGAQPSQAADGKEQAMAAFRRVSSDEAAKMMTEEKDYLILDVRRRNMPAGTFRMQSMSRMSPSARHLRRSCRTRGR